jgi:hypothetical protein
MAAKFTFSNTAKRSGDYRDKKSKNLLREGMFLADCGVCRACDPPLRDEVSAGKL